MSFFLSSEQQAVPERDENTAAIRQAAWRSTLIGLAVGLAVVFVSYFEGIVNAIFVWNGSAAHRFSYLVIPLSAYFVFLRRADLSRMVPQPSIFGIFFVVPFGLLWLVSEAAQVSVGMHLAVMGVVQASFLTILGWRVYRALLFPLLFLWLLVPFGDFLIPKLTNLTTEMTFAGLKLSGLEVEVLGNSLITGRERYEIVSECSAFDFLIGNLVISLVFANLMYRGITRRMVYVLASAPVAILANNLRTTSIVLITEMSDGRIDLASNHQTYGWLLFFFAISAQMAVGLYFRDALNTPGRAPHTVVAAAMTPSPMRRRLPLAVCGIVLAALVAPAYAALVVDRSKAPATVRLCFPPSVEIGRPASGEAGEWRPVFPAAHARLSRVLKVDGRAVELFVAYYWRQGPDAELVGWGNRFYGGKSWRYESSSMDVIHVDGQPLQVTSIRLYGPDNTRRIVWAWYWVNGQMTARPWQAKLIQAMAVLFGGDRRAAAVAISTDEQGAPEAARRTLQSALKRNPVIGDWLGGVTARDSPRHTC